MKLNKDTFAIHKCTEKEWYYFIADGNPKEVIEQILKNQEKAEKCMNENHEQNFNDCYYRNEQLEQENKELKEKLEKIKTFYLEWVEFKRFNEAYAQNELKEILGTSSQNWQSGHKSKGEKETL